MPHRFHKQPRNSDRSGQHIGLKKLQMQNYKENRKQKTETRRQASVRFAMRLFKRLIE